MIGRILGNGFVPGGDKPIALVMMAHSGYSRNLLRIALTRPASLSRFPSRPEIMGRVARLACPTHSRGPGPGTEADPQGHRDV